MPELEGKTVLITGSGSLGGIGADSALLFAQHGAEVLVAGRHTERGQRVVETILQAGGTARFLLADLAMDSLTRYWAAEFAQSNVRVNAIAVGPTSTDNVTAAMTSLGPGVIEGMAASIPLGRWASPREISEFILFLASERSSFATGGVFAADGGKVAV
jgi:NAD(P)-dependent dehydrogenase (short-subunit alcohol dehydrogenase family)